jgi:hypothetical protein
LPRAGARAAEARSAVRFAHDSATQNYVELEGGGRAAFAELGQGRRLRAVLVGRADLPAGRVSEVVIRFRPDGASNGFGRRVAETYVRDATTKALSAAAARTLAEQRATVDWQVDLKPYTLLEQSQQTRPSGRIDHASSTSAPTRWARRTFGCGSRSPATSSRRSRRTCTCPSRSIAGSASCAARTTRSPGLPACPPVSSTASVAASSACCGSRGQHWLAVRPALAAGFVVGGLMAATTLSAAPTAWFDFDTAQSVTTFWLRQVGACGGGDRRRHGVRARVHGGGKPHAARLSPPAPAMARLVRAGGASREVLGRTLGGYGFVPIELALIACFYYATNRWLGWWQPSESLTDPNILSFAVPALMPIAVSLQAGFMEEVPLPRRARWRSARSSAQRFGHRRAGIAVAFVLQALVFGGAHANYPGFPSYSRLVELVLPSMVWAAIFLRFGLLPTILLHALYDLALFSIPLFLVDAPGAADAATARDRRRAGAACGRAVAEGQGGRVERLAPRARQPRVDAACRGPPSARRRAAQRRPPAARTSRSARCPMSGLAGLIAWLVFAPMRADVPTMALDRAAAEAAADAALKARGVALGPEWRRFSTVREASDDAQWTQHKFVWREAGAAIYRGLDRGYARAAAMGRAVCDVRRRRRGASRGVARHHRAFRQGAAGAARAARGAAGRAPRRRTRPLRSRNVTSANISVPIPPR